MEERSLNEKEDSESETTDTTKKRTRQTRKTIHPLPDGRVSTENLIKVIKGLDVASKKGEVSVSYHDITPYAGIHKTQVSGALKFLYDLDLVDRENFKYTPKQEISEFCSRLAFKDTDAGEVFRKKFLESWFGEHVVKLFQIHPERTQEDLIKSIGIYAQADEYHHLALSRILDFLVYAKILEFDETNGKFKLTEVDLSQEKTKKIKHMGEEEKEISKERITTPFEQEIAATKEIKPPNDLRININVSIDENSDVEAIAKKIIDLKRELHSSNKDETQNS